MDRRAALAMTTGVFMVIAAALSLLAMSFSISLPKGNMKIIWKDSYRVGNETIDREHEAQFAMGNELLAAKDRASLTACAMNFYKHLRKHFEGEEKLMRELGFSDYLRHRESHNQLITLINGMSESIAADRWDPQSLHNVITIWTDHILHADSKLARYIDPHRPLDTQ